MEVKRVRLKVDEIELVGELYIPLGNKTHPALCICHGIPAAPPDPTNRGYASLAQMFCNNGFITMIFNFRGTGKSGGNLDILGWSRDLEVVLNFLDKLEEVDKTRVCLLGFSGGAAVCVYNAAHDLRISSVVTCACPADFAFFTQEEEASSNIRWFRQIGAIRDRDFPPSFEEWQNGFETISPIKWVDKISPRSLLLVHGDADEVVPMEHALRLYDKAQEPKELSMIQDAKHRLRVEEAAMSVVLEWLKARC